MLKRLLTYTISLTLALIASIAQAQPMLEKSFSAGPADQFVVPQLAKRQLRLADIHGLLDSFATSKWVKRQVIGQSFEGRPIYRLSVGSGDTVVLMWSQMHGDESTATAALFDLLLRVEQDDAWRSAWIDKLTVHIIPMLNPDGAERGQRENAQGIDINRDAQALQSPEARLLRQQAEALKPDFAFNLHDQNDYYAVGRSAYPATISVLAPAFDVNKSVNASRQRAMQVIAQLMTVMDTYLPGHTGRYNDTYEWRAFGDLFSAFGISTILLESGAYFNDPERQLARALNRALLSQALLDLASRAYENADVERYWQIPLNRSNGFHDLLVDGVTVSDSGQSYQLDIAIRRSKDRRRGMIESVGDQSTVNAFARFNAAGFDYRMGRAYAIPATGLALQHTDYQQLLQQGYSHFIGAAEQLQINTSWPVVINPKYPPGARPQADQNASFLLAKGSAITHAVLQGQLFTLTETSQ